MKCFRFGGAAVCAFALLRHRRTGDATCQPALVALARRSRKTTGICRRAFSIKFQRSKHRALQYLTPAKTNYKCANTVSPYLEPPSDLIDK